MNLGARSHFGNTQYFSISNEYTMFYQESYGNHGKFNIRSVDTI
jgi:hypothetical protein